MNDKSLRTGQMEGFDEYMRGVTRYDLLTPEEEQQLAFTLFHEQDDGAKERLITANLRFVAKIALEYKNYGYRILDIVQEGNLGLMHAVNKFDPNRGYRLITYAVWWIRAYIQAYVLKSWSMVKIGTTQAQRKLFFKLRGAQQRLEGSEMTPRQKRRFLAETLGVREKDISMMQMRLAARDFSLHRPMDHEGETTHQDMLTAVTGDPQDAVYQSQMRQHLRVDLEAALSGLNEREREVTLLRHLSDKPPTLREVGEKWGVSRERARQIEAAARTKLKRYMSRRSRVLVEVLPHCVAAPERAAA